MTSSGDMFRNFVLHHEQVKKSDGPFLLIRYCLIELDGDKTELSYVDWFVVEREGSPRELCSGPGLRSEAEPIADRLNKEFIGAGHRYISVSRFYTAQMAPARGRHKAIQETTVTVDASGIERIEFQEWVQGPNGISYKGRGEAVSSADLENEKEVAEKALLSNEALNDVAPLTQTDAALIDRVAEPSKELQVKDLPPNVPPTPSRGRGRGYKG